MSKLDLTVMSGAKTERVTIDEPVEIGRQQSASEPLFRVFATSGRKRLAVADRNDDTLSRSHLLIEPEAGEGRFRVVNLSEKHPVTLDVSGTLLQPGARSDVLSGLQLITLGAQRRVSVRVEPAGEDALHTTGLPCRAPGEGQLIVPPRDLEVKNLPVEQLLGLIEENVAVFQTCKPEELYQKAAEAAHKVVGLHAVQVLLLHDGREEVVAQVGEKPRSTLVRLDALHQVRGKKTAFVSRESMRSPKSRLELAVVAAAPLMNRRGQVIGALYGERFAGEAPDPERQADPGVTRLEAILLQQLARETSLALDRDEMTRLTAYVEPDQAEAVMADPSWRNGRTVPVTVLFCDVAGFTKITAGPDSMTALEWSGDVLNMLTGCVRKHKGTLIDYTGDGLFALWGAPIPQHDRAGLACEAALDMVRGLGAINEKWQEKLGQETRLRVGLNSGQATAGNIGSIKFTKFGVHGKTVNVGKRIETAAKLFKCPILLSQSTYHLLDVTRFSVRRLARIEVEGDDAEQFDAYELCHERRDGDGRDWSKWRQVYESALLSFEEGVRKLDSDRVRQAGNEIGQWRQANVWDRPALMLLRRIVNAGAEDDLKGQSWVMKVMKG